MADERRGTIPEPAGPLINGRADAVRESYAALAAGDGEGHKRGIAGEASRERTGGGRSESLVLCQAESARRPLG